MSWMTCDRPVNICEAQPGFASSQDSIRINQRDYLNKRGFRMRRMTFGAPPISVRSYLDHEDVQGDDTRHAAGGER